MYCCPARKAFQLFISFSDLLWKLFTITLASDLSLSGKGYIKSRGVRTPPPFFNTLVLHPIKLALLVFSHFSFIVTKCRRVSHRGAWALRRSSLVERTRCCLCLPLSVVPHADSLAWVIAVWIHKTQQIPPSYNAEKKPWVFVDECVCVKVEVS